jgi:hypothetical protein
MKAFDTSSALCRRRIRCSCRSGAAAISVPIADASTPNADTVVTFRR